MIVTDQSTLTAFGSLRKNETILAICGFIITSVLYVRKIPAAMLIGIIVTSLIGWISKVSPWPEAFADKPPAIGDVFGKAFVGLGKLDSSEAWVDFISALFVFLFVDLFDTIGTLSGVGKQAGYLTESGELPRANKALLSDSIATTVGAIFGTSPVTTFVESTAGIAEGGRTGFTSVVTALWFVLSVFLIPVFAAIPGYATAPVLVLVGTLMLMNIKQIDWEDITEAIPAFLVIFMIPLTFSIAEGLAVGFIMYPVVKTVAGRWKEVPIATWVIAVLFVGRFIFMAFQFS